MILNFKKSNLHETNDLWKKCQNVSKYVRECNRLLHKHIEGIGKSLILKMLRNEGQVEKNSYKNISFEATKQEIFHIRLLDEQKMKQPWKIFQVQCKRRSL